MYAIKLNDIAMAKLLLNYKSIDEGLKSQHLVATKNPQTFSDSNNVKIQQRAEMTAIKQEKKTESTEDHDDQKLTKKPSSLAGTESEGFVMTSQINLAHQVSSSQRRWARVQAISAEHEKN